MANLKQHLGQAQWHSEPPNWALTETMLSLTTGEKTDFWQDTFYGFHRDDGHFLGLEIAGDFTAVVGFDADYETLYDQAGMMMRLDARNWLKTGIEFSDDVTNFSTVVTRDGRSDWSVVAVPAVSGVQHVRLTRVAGAIIAHFREPNDTWRLMRLADFPAEASVAVGPMACSPERAGLDVRFSMFEIGGAIDDPLHAV
ncbi:MAG: DUF1349 domain-containing protein [Pseudomonadota bacterium]